MKYETNVIHKGVFYPAGTDVPAGELTEEKCENEEVDAEQSNEESVEEPEKPKRGRKPKE